MTRKKGMLANSEPDPLSWKNIVSGLIVTVLGGIILAYVIQDARFSPDQTKIVPTITATFPPDRTVSMISTIPPNSIRTINSTTVTVNIDENSTLSIYDGELFISVTSIEPLSNIVWATIGIPGCVNQEIKDGPIGYAIIYECGEKYDIRVGSIKRRGTFWTQAKFSVEFYVTELEK